MKGDLLVTTSIEIYRRAKEKGSMVIFDQKPELCKKYEKELELCKKCKKEWGKGEYQREYDCYISNLTKVSELNKREQ